MADCKIPTGKYKHYKGKYYEVLGTVIHSETLEELVLYKALYASTEYPESTLWVRPLSLFAEHVLHNEIRVPRFKFIGG